MIPPLPKAIQCSMQSQSLTRPRHLASDSRSRWLPSRLNVSVTRHYKLTHPTSGVKPSFLSLQHPSPGEIPTPLAPLIQLLYTPRSSTMKFSTILVLYLSAMAAPAVLAAPLRHGDRCSSSDAGVRCVGHSDDRALLLDPSFNGGNTFRELSHRHAPSAPNP